MKHYCRWLNGRQCWQKGKHIRKSECSPCLVAAGFQMVAGFATSLKKNPKMIK